jgi:curved DNA-binding protein CbpA
VDLYGVLRVAPGASDYEIQVAFAELVSAWKSQTLNRSNGVDTRLAELNHAFAVLSDPISRAAYDLGRQDVRERGSGSADAGAGTINGAERENAPSNWREEASSDRESASSKLMLAVQIFTCLTIYSLLRPSVGHVNAAIAGALPALGLGFFATGFIKLPLWARIVLTMISFVLLLAGLIIGEAVRKGSLVWM